MIEGEMVQGNLYGVSERTVDLSKGGMGARVCKQPRGQ